MSSPQTNASKPKTPASPAQTVVRIILFAILAYMIFALAYDYGYVFPTHEAKAEELRKLVDAEVARSATDRRDKGPAGPEQVQEIMGFEPSVPLEKKDQHFHERYTYRRALPWLSRTIDVYYKQYEGDSRPGIVSVAHTEEDIEETEPKGPVVPSDVPAAEDDTTTEDDKKTGDDKKSGDETSPEPTPETSKEDKTDDKKSKAATDEPSIDDANPPTKD